jgi:hypothetical protein
METDKEVRNAEKSHFQKRLNPEIEEGSGILKRRRKKISSKVDLSIPKKPLTAYAIFIKQVSLLHLPFHISLLREGESTKR